MTPELQERCVALVRGMSNAPMGHGFLHFDEARAIAADPDFPREVDPLLIEAREICHEVLMRLGASSEMIAAGDIKAGDRDDAIVMHVALTALRRGLEMRP